MPDLYDMGDSDQDDDDGSSSNSSHKRPQHRQQQQCKGVASAGSSSSSSAGLGADAPDGSYSSEVMTSLQIIDPSVINYDLIESLLVHIVTVQQQQGPTGLLKVGARGCDRRGM